MARLVVEFDGKNAQRQATDLEAVLKRLGHNANVATAEVRQLGGADRYVRDLGSGIKSNLLAPLGAAAIAAGAVGLAMGAIRGAVSLISSAVTSASEAQTVVAALEAGVRSTGGAAGYTTAQLSEMASQFERTTRFSDEQVASAERMTLAFTNVRGDTFRDAIAGATDLATALGSDLPQAAMMLGKALDNPAEGLTALGRAGVKFTQAEQEVLDHMVETGRAAEAQGIILDRVSQKFGGSAAADLATYSGSLSKLNNVWDNFLEVVGGRVLPIFANLFTQFSNLIEANGDTAESIARLIEYAVRFTLVGAGVLSMVAELTLSLGSRLVRAQAAVADGFAAITFGPASDHFKEMANEARGNADAMDLVAGVADKAADAFLRAGIGFGEASTASSVLKGELRELTPEELAAAAAAAKLAESQKKAAEEAAQFAEQLRDVREFINPAEASIRELHERLDVLHRAYGEGKMTLSEYRYLVDQLTASTTSASDALFDEATGLFRVNRNLDLPLLPVEFEKPVPIEITADTTDYQKEINAANASLASNLEQGFTGAFASSFVAFAKGGDDVLEDFGKMLLDVLLNAVAQWLAAQLAATAKAALAAQSIQGGSGGGGGGWMGSIAKLFGGGGGAGATGGAGAGVSGGTMGQGSTVSSGAGGMGAAAGWAIGFAAVLAGIYAIFKHQDDRQNARDYETHSRVSVDNGNVTNSYVGRLSESGPQVAAAMDGLLEGLQHATGLWIKGTHDAEIAIRNDKEGFYLKINEEIVGNFKSVREALMAAAKEMFVEGELSGILDERLASVINNFEGTDPEQLFEQLNAVRAIIDEVEGLSEIEIALRDLPQATSALSSELRGMGLSMNDSAELAAQWQAKQYQNLRDQITGHQQTAAEEMAQKQREAAMFNAQITMDKARIASEIAVLEAKIQIANGANEIANAEIGMQAAVLSAKADLVEDEFRIENGRLVGIAAFNQASSALLQQQIDALKIAQGYLEGIELIRPEEIRINRGGGGGGGNVGTIDNIDPGPSEAEMRVISFIEFLENARLANLTNYERALAELNRTFTAQRVTLDEMIAASDGSAESLAELAEQELALADARSEAAAQLREEVIDGFNLPMEGVRDRIAAIREQVDAWHASGQELVDQFHAGAIGMDELMAALAEANSLWAEFGAAARAELMNLALYFTDALGNTEQSAALRAQLAEMEWDFRRAEFRMLLEMYRSVGAIGDEDYANWLAFVDALPDDLPTPDTSGGGSGGYEPPPPPVDTSEEDALRDLINALESLADLQRDLWGSDLSPLNAEQQVNYLGGQLQSAYEAAMASGSAEDIQTFQNLIRDYLESYQSAYGSTGNYTAEFLRINELINNLLGLGGINGIPNSTINTDPGAGTGGNGWRPTPGANSVPFALERTGGPSSPLVVEAPGVTARLETMTQRLEMLERRLSGIEAATRDGNREAASREFRAGWFSNEVGFSGIKNTNSRRGA